jgi:hypothetical protein
MLNAAFLTRMAGAIDERRELVPSRKSDFVSAIAMDLSSIVLLLVVAKSCAKSCARA